MLIKDEAGFVSETFLNISRSLHSSYQATPIWVSRKREACREILTGQRCVTSVYAAEYPSNCVKVVPLFMLRLFNDVRMCVELCKDVASFPSRLFIKGT